MRVVLRQEQPSVDLCSINGFHSVIDSNPDLMLLVTKPDCGEKCDVLRTVVDQIADSKGLPVMEVEFSKKMEGECPSLDREVRAEVGSVIVYRGGKEKGRRKGSGFAEHDREVVERLLS